MTDKSGDVKRLVPITEYPGNVKYSIQMELQKLHRASVISEIERHKSFSSLVRILFTNHLTFVTRDGQKAEGALLGEGIDKLIAASLLFYVNRSYALSVGDYVTDILDISRSQDLFFALK